MGKPCHKEIVIEELPETGSLSVESGLLVTNYSFL